MASDCSVLWPADGCSSEVSLALSALGVCDGEGAGADGAEISGADDAELETTETEFTEPLPEELDDEPSDADNELPKVAALAPPPPTMDAGVWIIGPLLGAVLAVLIVCLLISVGCLTTLAFVLAGLTGLGLALTLADSTRGLMFPAEALALCIFGFCFIVLAAVLAETK